jgi:hypothetical protein
MAQLNFENVEDDSQVARWPISKKSKNCLVGAGYLDLDSIKPLTLDDLKEIKGLGAKSLAEIREWCSSKFGLVFKSRPKVKKKVIKNYKDSKKVVEHLVPETKDWGNQLRIADILIEKYGVELLLKVPRDAKIYSLAWYATDYGDKRIRQYMEKEIIEDVSVEKAKDLVFEEKSVFDIEVQKPKTLKDFLGI